MELYEWQKGLYDKWKKASYRGILKAVPGSGKTIGALTLLFNDDEDVKESSCLIVVPSTTLYNQWKNITDPLKEKYLLNIKVATINWCRNNKYTCDILIIDEIHNTTSPENIKVYDNIKYKKIIGLTASPNDTNLKMFPVIESVGFQESNVSEFIVYFHKIDLVSEERDKYEKYSHKIRNMGLALRGVNNRYEKEKMKNIIKFLALHRRRVVYNAVNSDDKLKEIYNPDEKTLIITRSIKSAEEIGKEFNVPTYHSKNTKYLDDFKDNIYKTIVSVNMLNEGVDIPDIKTIIIYAGALSNTFHIQTIGRGIRKYGNKIAKIHIILAKNTTDEKILNHTHSYDYEYRIIE